MNHKPVIGLSMNYMKLGSYMQFHIRDKYIDAVYEHGALPLPIPCFEDRDILKQYLEKCDALIIIGGLDYPPELYNEIPHPKTEPMEHRRAQSDLLLLELALNSNKPVLGICAGMQLINIYFGGKLIQHLDNLDQHYGEKFHTIHISGSRHLGHVVKGESITVNSNHHQGVDPSHLGKGLKVVAMSDDGYIEALEQEDYPNLLGIQWHPERMTDLIHRKRIFDYFIALASEAKCKA